MARFDPHALPAHVLLGRLLTWARRERTAGEPWHSAAEKTARAPLVEQIVRQNEPLRATPHWQHSSFEGRVGMLGEALRLDQVRASLPASRVVVQGIVVVRVPPELATATSAHDARQWCGSQRLNGALTRFQDASGRNRFGLGVTEIDVAVLVADEQGLRLERIENVKAGTGAADVARRQNRQAIAAIADPEMRFLIRQGDRLVDMGARLARGPQAATLAQSITVGPSDGAYDARLPLSCSEILYATHRLD